MQIRVSRRGGADPGGSTMDAALLEKVRLVLLSPIGKDASVDQDVRAMTLYLCM